MKDRLLKSGAIINTKETCFDRYRKEIEIGFRKDSDVLRQYVRRIISDYPGLQMSKSCQVGQTGAGKAGLLVWTHHEPCVSVTLSIEECGHVAEATRVPLQHLLSKIADNGCKNTMAFRISTDVQVWDKVVGTADCAG